MVGYRGETALHTAARDLNEDAIFALLKLKADPNIQVYFRLNLKILKRDFDGLKIE